MNANFKSVMDSIIDNPTDYVLKPQREGGGNNFYNDEIRYVGKCN